MNPRSIIRSFIGIALLLWCSSTASWATEWTLVRSTNFVVAGEVTEAEIRSVAMRLEQFRDAFGSIFPKLRTENKVPIRVLIFRDPESYRDFRPRRPDGSPDEAVAGYFIAGEAVNYITLAMRGGKADPYHTIFHEYIHFLLKSNTGRNDLPAWLGEGLAQYFETLRLTADGTAVIGEPPQGRVGTLRRGTLLPWRDFFATERSSLHGTADVSRSMFYAQSWLLVHYLMHMGQEASQTRLDRLLGLLTRSSAAEVAIKDAFQVEPADIDSSFRAYLELPTLPVTTAKLNDSQVGSVEKTSTTISEAQSRAYMGDLLLHMNRLDDAESHLRAAIASDNSLVAAHASLGALLLRRDRAIDALRHLEIAVTKGSPTYFDHFNYAYALSQTSSKGGMVSRFPGSTAEKMRNSLRRSIELGPAFSESYRLLAFLNYVNDEDANEAASLLEDGLRLKPGDEAFEMLLARVRVRQERFDEARRLAERLRGSNDAQVRKEAIELLSSITQFTRAKLQITTLATNRALPWSPAMVLLKRSWVNEADIAAVEKIREMANLNRLLERTRPGEERMLGTIEQIDCAKGNIIYNVKSGSEKLRFTGERFDEVRMGVLVSGQHTFQIDCGTKLPSHPVVLMYLRSAGKRRSVDNLRLTSITFVPDHFELWPVERLAASRTVVIEDDLVRRNSQTAEGFTTLIAGPEARWASIAKNLRKVDQGERRVAGVLEAVECSENGYIAVAAVDGKKVRFRADADLVPTWFSIHASQVPLACGSRPQVSNVLFTYRSDDKSDDLAPMLEAMEFLPDDFPLEKITGPAR